MGERIGGRQTGLTPDVSRAIVELVRKGAFPSGAAEQLRIPASNVSDWLKRGEREETEPFRSFFLDVRAAESLHEQEMLALAREFTITSPKHAFTYLSRRWPQRWARHDNLTIDNKGDAPDQAKVADAHMRLIDMLTKAIQAKKDEDGSNAQSSEPGGSPAP